MKHYFRPIPSVDAARTSQAQPLAGGWCWFDRVEVLSHGAPAGRPGEIITAAEVPEDVLQHLCSPRPPLMGLDMNAGPHLMGILNVTPDSFSDGGQLANPDAAAQRACAMVAAGASIIDIGGESTRPGADIIAPNLEISRVIPAIEAMRSTGITTPISLDTRKSTVAQAGLAAGAGMINDVSAFSYDTDLRRVTSEAGVPVCLMHASGTPKTMQAAVHYSNVILEVYDYLEEKIIESENAGIDRARIIIDPGIGFGKDLEHNLALLSRISLFHALGVPLLLGASRKRFIGSISGVDNAHLRAPGSISVAMAALSQGVQIIRAHDIAETSQAMALHMALIKGRVE